MDRDTIKTLLMTTSVVAIIAGSAQEANAFICDVTITGPTTQPGFTQTTNANCIFIDNAATITSDITLAVPATLGGGTFTGAVVTIDNSVLQGGLFNNTTIVGTPTFAQDEVFIDGIKLIGGSKVANGITNGASTGLINIAVHNSATNISGAEGGGAGILVQQSSFTGNLVNNGVIDVSVLVDPLHDATATATGMGVISTSFVGNVINTHVLNVSATAIAGSGTDRASPRRGPAAS